MFGWIFGSRKEVEKLKEDVKKSFETAKNDINSVNVWIKHLHDKHSSHENFILEINSRLSTIENDLEELKNSLSLLDSRVFKQLFKTPKGVYDKQTAVYAVQTGVQTPVQTGVLSNISSFSVTERAIVSVLLNTDLKLSYDDLAAMLGKSRATIRGQINSIKQKSESLVEEIIEGNGKKRVFIPDEIREKMLKYVKVRVGKEKKGRKQQEEE